MLKEFMAFVNKGNALDLAVGVIIGAAFGKIVTALTDDIIMPIVSLFTGGMDFSGMFATLGKIPDGFKGDPGKLADLKAAKVATLAYGDLISVIINFVIMAFVVFMLVRWANKLMNRHEDAATPEDVLLLREIRDNLKK
jgi:large conductance mechanosensitive channel